MIIIIMLFILGLGCIAGLTVYNITQEIKTKNILNLCLTKTVQLNWNAEKLKNKPIRIVNFTLRDKIVATDVSGTATWGTDSRTFYKLIWVSAEDEIITWDIDLQYGYRYNLGDTKTRQELNEK